MLKKTLKFVYKDFFKEEVVGFAKITVIMNMLLTILFLLFCTFLGKPITLSNVSEVIIVMSVLCAAIILFFIVFYSILLFIGSISYVVIKKLHNKCLVKIIK